MPCLITCRTAPDLSAVGRSGCTKFLPSPPSGLQCVSKPGQADQQGWTSASLTESKGWCHSWSQSHVCRREPCWAAAARVAAMVQKPVVQACPASSCIAAADCPMSCAHEQASAAVWSKAAHMHTLPCDHQVPLGLVITGRRSKTKSSLRPGCAPRVPMPGQSMPCRVQP